MAIAYGPRGSFRGPISVDDQPKPLPDPVPVPRRRIQTRHASYVLVTLIVLGVLLLGCYEALAGYVNPDASLFAQSSDPNVSEVWLQVSSPTPAYWPDHTQAWSARPPERYRMIHEQEGWALAIREGDAVAHQVWLPLDGRVQRR
jgi:hypothetical protein